MLIYVVGDTHGHVDGFLNKVEEIGRPDQVFFLGDYLEDLEKIKKVLGVEVVGVKGNGDLSNRDYRNEELLEIKGYKIFLTHGHLYDVNFDISNLYYRGQELGADLVFFGHTHKPLKVEESGITILNPGSPSYPRARSNEKTFIKLSLDDGLKYKFIEV